MTRHIRAAVLAMLVLSILSTGGASAQCRVGEAQASITGGARGYVLSSHFGRMTKYECFGQRLMALKTEVHVNDTAAVDQLHQGPPEYLGGSMFKDYEFQSCTGKWDSSTRFGTLTAMGALDILDYATSGILFASCPPPPPPCGSVYEDTSTWTLGPDGPRLAERQLGFGLSRSEERPEGFYIFDEWAMLGMREDGISMRLSSVRDFKERVADAAEFFRPAEGRARRLLVVEAGNHPHNSRHIPLPSFVPMKADLGHLALGYGRRIEGDLWFRAEVAPTGEVDELIILESSVPVAEQYLHEAIRENLAVRFETDKRHRVVVFGFARVDANGLLSSKDAVVVRPACCCGGKICT